MEAINAKYKAQRVGATVKVTLSNHHRAYIPIIEIIELDHRYSKKKRGTLYMDSSRGGSTKRPSSF